MTEHHEAVRAAVLTRRDLDELRAVRDIDGLAAALNAIPLQAMQPRFITARTILAECADGGAILDALTAAGEGISTVKWALTFLSQDSGLDVGHPATHAMIDQLAAGGLLPAAHGAALKALAVLPLSVTAQLVAEATYNPDGTEK